MAGFRVDPFGFRLRLVRKLSMPALFQLQHGRGYGSGFRDMGFRGVWGAGSKLRVFGSIL